MKNSIHWITSVAALFILAFAVMIWYWRFPIVVQAPYGGQITTRLPDQSRVTLNSGTRIEYSRRFESWPFIKSTERSVLLHGEAYFEINEMSKPFVIELYNARVSTEEANVNIWSRAHDTTPGTRVTQIQGQVAISSYQSSEKPIIMSSPNESVMIKNIAGKLDVTQLYVPGEYFLAWLENHFSVKDVALSSIVPEIERRYNVTVQLSEQIDKTEKFTFSLQNATSADSLLQKICDLSSCTYSRDNNNNYQVSPI